MYQGYCVYLLTGTRNYVGSTNNLERRLIEHTRGEYSTKRIGTRKLTGYIPCDTLLIARRLEKKIKQLGHYQITMLNLGMVVGE